MAKPLKKASPHVGRKAEIASSKHVHAATLHQDDDDGYGDDFEDYEDDDTFEAHMQAPAAKKQEHVVRSVLTRERSAASLTFDVDALQESVKEENARSAKRVEQLRHKNPTPSLAEAKSPPSTAPSSHKKAASKKLTSKPRRHFALVDPRLNRAKKVRALLSLQSERFVAFESLPLTPYQWYSLNLTRTGRAEKAIATRDNLRDVEEQTVAFEVHDAEMHFAEGQDETDFENALRGFRKRGGTTSVARLPTFLRGAAPVVEAVLEEKLFGGNAASSDDNSAEPLFADWRTLPGTGGSFGQLRFALRSSVLALYGDENADPFGVEHTVLVRLFDASSPWTQSPKPMLLELQGPGVASCVCLPPQRVLAGTEGGLVVMWELPKSQPAYSSACFSLTEAAHTGRILAIEAVGTSFVSIDAYAKICVWQLVPETLKEDDDDDLAALGAEPGATWRLKLVRALYAWTRVPARIFYPTKTYQMLLASAQGVIDTDIISDAKNEELSIDGRPLPLLSTVAAGRNPNDPLDLLFGICDNGLVFRPHSENTPDVYFANDEAREEALRGIPGSCDDKVDSKAGEDCAGPEMANAIAQHPTILFLFLVGQLNGTTRLHILDEQLPLRIWEPHKVDVAVVSLQWSPCRPALFFVLYSDLRVAAYDMLARNPDQQQHVYDLAASFGTPQRPPCFALASGKGALSSRLLAVDLGGKVQVCRLSTLGTTQQQPDEGTAMLSTLGLDRHGDLALPLAGTKSELAGNNHEHKADESK